MKVFGCPLLTGLNSTWTAWPWVVRRSLQCRCALSEPSLFLSCSLVLAAVLIVGAEAKVALAPSRSDAARHSCGWRPCVDTLGSRERGD